MIDDPKKRKVLTIFAGLLMVAFILPSYVGGGGGRGRGGGDFVVAYFGPDKTPVTQEQVLQASRKWALLASTGSVVPTQDDPTRKLSAVEVLLPWLVRPELASLNIGQHPDHFLLMVLEAKARGISVSKDQVQDCMTNVIVRPAGMTQGQEIYLQEAVHDALTIRAGIQDVVRSVRLTGPQFETDYTALANTLKLGITLVDAGAMLAKMPEPSAEQVNAQFRKYSDALPNTGDVTTNPFGFGYRLPDRLQLQVIGVDRSEARRVARAKKSDYDWEVEAQKYYRQNLDRYKTDAVASSSALVLAPASQPTTRPFGAVRAEIEETLVAAAADVLTTDVIRRTLSTLNADYASYARTTAGAGAATAPSFTDDSFGIAPPAGPASTSVGVAYGTFEYLKTVAEREQAKSGVVLRVMDTGRLQSAAEVAKAPIFRGLVATVGGKPVPRSDGLGLIFYRADGLRPPARPTTGNELQLMMPSTELINSFGDVLLVRTAGQSPSHAPQAYGENEAKVREDCKLALAFDNAKSVAAKTVTAAKSGGLEAAARAAQLPFEATLPAPLNRAIVVTGGLEELSQQQLQQGVSNLLRATNPAEPPIAAIELPRDRKVAVVQLLKTERNPAVPPMEVARSIMLGNEISRSELAVGLAWLTEKELLTRNEWVKVNR